MDSGEAPSVDLQRVEDAAYGPRWLELAHGLLFPQLPAGLLG